jgi:asparagine synthetase B (glutamine-hydrolysing)
MDEFTDRMDFTIEKVGYGIGGRDTEIPNLLRIYLGEISLTESRTTEKDIQAEEAYLLECNIDDMNPDLGSTEERAGVIENKRYLKLLEYLKSLGPSAVGFSGGVDSTFLLRAAREALDEGVLAITLISPYMPKWEIQEASELVQALGIRHRTIRVPLPDEIRHNPPDRCYLCKRYLFRRIAELAESEGCQSVLDGTNADDLKNYKPGMRARRYT